ncbi:hypothetical protein D3C80_1721210 [compost metagenome]
MIGCAFLCAAALATTVYTSYVLYKQRQDNDLLSTAIDGEAGCALFVYDNPPGEGGRAALARKIKRLEPWMKQTLIIKNKVSREADLYDLDRVILCNPGPI